MKSITSLIPLVLTGAVLLAATLVLTTSRLEYCGQPETLQPHSTAVAVMARRCPTPAPPPKVVFVRVDADKPDLEIRWAEN